MRIVMTEDPLCADAITHGGVFHADEVMATVILGKVSGRLSVCRLNRLPEHYKKDAIVYDIGGGRFDHHQPGGNGERENGVPYASAGLIWREFGLRVTEGTVDPDIIWKRVDQELIQGIDAVDNGAVPASDYPARCLNAAEIISLQNPNWEETRSFDEAFAEAVRLAEMIFDSVYANVVSRTHADGIVEAAIDRSENHIMVLEQFVPWQECVFHSRNEKAAELHYVVYPSARGGYNWQCVPDVLHGFGQRKPVPPAWWGAGGEELQKLTGVKTAVFCHRSGFIGSAETYEDAYALAELAEREARGQSE